MGTLFIIANYQFTSTDNLKSYLFKQIIQTQNGKQNSKTRCRNDIKAN